MKNAMSTLRILAGALAVAAVLAGCAVGDGITTTGATGTAAQTKTFPPVTAATWTPTPTRAASPTSEPVSTCQGPREHLTRDRAAEAKNPYIIAFSGQAYCLEPGEQLWMVLADEAKAMHVVAGPIRMEPPMQTFTISLITTDLTTVNGLEGAWFGLMLTSGTATDEWRQALQGKYPVDSVKGIREVTDPESGQWAGTHIHG